MNHNLRRNTATALTARHRITIVSGAESNLISSFASQGAAVLTSRRLLPWKHLRSLQVTLWNIWIRMILFR